MTGCHDTKLSHNSGSILAIRVQSTTFDSQERILLVSVAGSYNRSIDTIHTCEYYVCFCFQWQGTYPVPISLKLLYLLRGSRDETCVFGNALRMRRSNSFSVRTRGGSCGISEWGPTGNQGFFEMCLLGVYGRRLYVFSLEGSGFKKALPRMSGIS